MFFSISNFVSKNYINIIFYVIYTKVQYSRSFSDTLWSEDDSFHIWDWKINIVIIKFIPPGTYPFPEFIHIFTHKKWPISSAWSQYEHTGELLIFISNNFLLQFMILLIILSSPVNICRVSKTPVHSSSDMSKSTCNVFRFNTHVGIIFSFAHNIHKLVLWCIYLTVKLYRCDKWKVPSQACVCTMTVSPVATLVAGFVLFVKPIESVI